MIKKILPILLIIGFINCSSSQKTMTMQEEVPFKTESVFAQVWTAGQENGGSGINVQMTITNLDTETIVLKDFYFRGRKTTLQDASTNNNGLFVAYFINSTKTEKEIMLHENHKKEAGNEPPHLEEKFPFTLENNEGVISYTENGTLKYHKVKNIIEKFPIHYPSAPENKQ
ncbi:hypothetical protein IMCC3317_27950 [Kordia antarctica]|uniref:Uncharacterized protein n=1 Tax=Kordia antarctica TaxID=1218801 RepID=A0A7L4ZMI6_9FLAO|nr:hypothetical protein [Kordia antarctica]QHI37416.1 hypothetical protein IMCC3317_27950 [Kordia antarctica]